MKNKILRYPDYIKIGFVLELSVINDSNFEKK